MNIKNTTRRARAAVVGTLLAGVVTFGAATGTASADEVDSTDAPSVIVQLDNDGSKGLMRGGIRW